MKLRITLSGLLVLLTLTGCQTTASEETSDTTEQENSTPTKEVAIPTIAALPRYLPIEGEKFTYALVNTDEIPDKQLRVLKETIESELRSGGKLAENGTAAKHVDFIFTSYRMRATGMRFAFGIMAGTDKVETMIHIKSLEGGEVLHSKLYRTGSAIAFRGTGEILRKHAKKVVKYIVEGRKK